jgi:hypothetical protein
VFFETDLAFHRALPVPAVILRCSSKNESRLAAALFGGARRNRTADLLNAIQALSQLSYGP